MKRRLIVFARYPEVGKCKTRLIPELGERGAAELHEAMAKHTLQWARKVQEQCDIDIEVRYAGGDEVQMAATFGSDFRYVPQCEGDLGKRLTEAFEQSLASGAEQVVVVGTDCPQLSASICRTAFAELDSHSVVIAPAKDGGYTLLGATAKAGTLPCSQLFDNKRWGTETVLADTVGALSKHGVFPRLLPALADVDYAEDLPVWDAARQGIAPAEPSISVVIPVLGEEDELAKVVDSALANADCEVILCVAGESSSALDVAVDRQVQLLPCTSPRGKQLNQGAASARTNALLFLHADTELPQGYGSLVLAALRQPGVIGGAFRLRIRTEKPLARFIEWGVSLRTRWLQLPYGDQGIFMQSQTFEAMGGFPEKEIMEDYVFAKESRGHGKLTMLQAEVITSGRRWQNLGFLKTTMVNQLMILGYRLGISDKKLAKFYRGRE